MMTKKTMLNAAICLLGFSVAGSFAQEENPLDEMAQNIPGVPGEDYPIYALPPDTPFSCADRVPGYYADQDAGCQMYHICAGPDNNLVKYDFLCPNGTLFDQQYFVCNWWFNVDCSQAQDFYSLNEEVLEAMLAATKASDDASVAISSRRSDVASDERTGRAKNVIAARQGSVKKVDLVDLLSKPVDVVKTNPVEAFEERAASTTTFQEVILQPVEAVAEEDYNVAAAEEATEENDYEEYTEKDQTTEGERIIYDNLDDLLNSIGVEASETSTTSLYDIVEDSTEASLGE